MDERGPRADTAPTGDRVTSAVRGAFGGVVALLRGLLKRPLASYYLLVSSAGLLLLIGLTMVFSATSVRAFVVDGNAYTSLQKQAISALVGLFAFGGLQVQPSELAKIALVVWTADVLVRKGRMVGRWRDLARPLFPVAGLLFLLVGY